MPFRTISVALTGNNADLSSALRRSANDVARSRRRLAAQRTTSPNVDRADGARVPRPRERPRLAASPGPCRVHRCRARRVRRWPRAQRALRRTSSAARCSSTRGCGTSTASRAVRGAAAVSAVRSSTCPSSCRSPRTPSLRASTTSRRPGSRAPPACRCSPRPRKAATAGPVDDRDVSAGDRRRCSTPTAKERPRTVRLRLPVPDREPRRLSFDDLAQGIGQVVGIASAAGVGHRPGRPGDRHDDEGGHQFRPRRSLAQPAHPQIIQPSAAIRP
jgi:hypothetical protein